MLPRATSYPPSPSPFPSPYLSLSLSLCTWQIPTHGMSYSRDNPLKPRFHETLEDSYGTLAQYYDLQYLSFRTAIWHSAERKVAVAAEVAAAGSHDFMFFPRLPSLIMYAVHLTYHPSPLALCVPRALILS